MIRVSLDPGILWQGGLCVVYAHPSTIPGWSEYLWIPGYSDKGGCVWCMPIPGWSRDGQSISGSRDTLTRGCMPIPVQSQDGQSISGSWDTLTRGVVCGVCPSRYNPGMVRVSLDPGINALFHILFASLHTLAFFQVLLHTSAFFLGVGSEIGSCSFTFEVAAVCLQNTTCFCPVTGPYSQLLYLDN